MEKRAADSRRGSHERSEGSRESEVVGRVRERELTYTYSPDLRPTTTPSSLPRARVRERVAVPSRELKRRVCVLLDVAAVFEKIYFGFVHV